MSPELLARICSLAVFQASLLRESTKEPGRCRLGLGKTKTLATRWSGFVLDTPSRRHGPVAYYVLVQEVHRRGAPLLQFAPVGLAVECQFLDDLPTAAAVCEVAPQKKAKRHSANPRFCVELGFRASRTQISRIESEVISTSAEIGFLFGSKKMPLENRFEAGTIIVRMYCCMYRRCRCLATCETSVSHITRPPPPPMISFDNQTIPSRREPVPACDRRLRSKTSYKEGSSIKAQ